ncbi:MAG: lysophospholipid acyltransferase family protein [Proteobacteria bacterium]|nr:lysophospholipid acyltransferase family protein [Pseudomonadota bacterium]
MTHEPLTAARPAVADGRLETWLRRGLTIPLTFGAWALLVATAPLWIPLAAVLDAASGWRRSALRCLAFLLAYLCCEVVGIAASAALWLRSVGAGEDVRSEAGLQRNFALQLWWARTLLAAGARCFDLRFEVEGAEEAGREPMLLMLRHASTADTVLAAVFLQAPHRVRLRYVMKRELLFDPCLDIVGNRLPNAFVRRGSADPEPEIRAVRDLCVDLGPREGVLIYPEGTRFDPAKRARVIERLRERGDREALEHALSLEHVLPARPGGPLALLEANPGLDVVFGAHTGFEGAASFGAIWNGAWTHQTVRVRFWRVAHGEIPAGRIERRRWLMDQWSRMDREVGALAARDTEVSS